MATPTVQRQSFDQVVASAEPIEPRKTLFERLGGDAAIDAAVDVFYKKVLADPLLLPFFEGVNMNFLKRKQRMFMTFAFGGPIKYDGAGIAAAHAHLIRDHGLNLTHFDAVAGHFVATLQELAVPEDLINEAAGIVLTTRPIFDPANLAK